VFRYARQRMDRQTDRQTNRYAEHNFVHLPGSQQKYKTLAKSTIHKHQSWQFQVVFATNEWPLAVIRYFTYTFERFQLFASKFDRFISTTSEVMTLQLDRNALHILIITLRHDSMPHDLKLQRHHSGLIKQLTQTDTVWPQILTRTRTEPLWRSNDAIAFLNGVGVLGVTIDFRNTGVNDSDLTWLPITK